MEFELLFMAHDLNSARSECGTQDMVRDLRVDILLDAMSGGNAAIQDICGRVMARPLADTEGILARRAVVQDAIACSDAFFRMFDIAGDALQSVRASMEYTNPKYDRVIPNAKKIVTEAEIAKLNLKHLRCLGDALNKYSGGFSSDAMRSLCRSVNALFEGDGFSRVELRVQQLDALKASGGLSVGGHIGEGLKQSDVLLEGLCEPTANRKKKLGSDEVSIPLSSMALIRNADEIVESALAPVHRAIAGFNRSFYRSFEKLHFQAGFFVGCVNLHRRLEALDVPMCYPQITSDAGEYFGTSLVDVSLTLREGRIPVGNSFQFSGKRQIVITGPNQGGKTTFLRGIGLAQVMAQCGMFVAARKLACPLFSGIFTHFPNSEDGRLQMGLLEVELRKLSEITRVLKRGALLMMNESLQNTMPLDAKRLADEIISALIDAGVTVFFVTHLFTYALDLYRQRRDDVLFLRAERGDDAQNTFKMQKGEPYKSAFGMDLFREIVMSK